MTRTEFLETVGEWYELKEFCWDYGCSYLDDISSGEDIREIVEENLEEYAHEYSWETLRDKLNEVPTDNDYYRWNGFGDWDYVNDNDDFDDAKQSVLDWADEREVFDAEDEEDYSEPEPEPEYEPEDDDEDVIFADENAFEQFVGMATIVLSSAKSEVDGRQQQCEQEFEELLELPF